MVKCPKCGVISAYPHPDIKAVQKFKAKAGYKNVETYGWAKVNIKELAKQVDLSRRTIYGIKDHYAIDPEKYKWDYEVKFEESKGWKMTEEFYKGTKHERYLDRIKKAMLEAYHFLGDKEPFGWTSEQIREVRKKCMTLRDPETGDIRPDQRTFLNYAFTAMGRGELKDQMLDVKKPKVTKIAWYLEDADYLKFIYGIEEIDTLMYFMLGTLGGARHSCITHKNTNTEGINREIQRFLMFEPKIGEYVERVMPRAILDLILEYAREFKIDPTASLFKWSYTTYNTRLVKVGKTLGLSKKTTTHIMKHTHVSLASYHGVSGDAIEKQTGTEWTTLKKFYRAEDFKFMDKEYLGKEYPVEPWSQFVERMTIHFQKRYEELLKRYPLVDGRRVEVTLRLEKPPKKEKPRRKRKLTIDQMKALATSPKTPPKIKAWAEKWLKQRGIKV